MNAWEVEYEVIFSEGLSRSAEGGWLVVDCLFQDTARRLAKKIVRECYVSEHNDPGEFLVSITSCVQV